MFRDGFVLWQQASCIGIAVVISLVVASGSALGIELTKVELTSFGVPMPDDLADVGGQLALAATADGQRELHFVNPLIPTDGSTEVELNPGALGSFPSGITDVAGLAVLAATETGDTELFIVDPTNLGAGGTKVNVSAGGSSSPNGIANVASLALFAATDSGDTELYVVDPTEVAPVAIKVDVNPAGSSNPERIVDVGGLAVFRATAVNGAEIQITDPTVVVPVVIEVDINPGPGSSTPSLPAGNEIVSVAGRAVLAAFDGTDTELFVVDPTGPTSTKVDIFAGSQSSFPASIASVAGQAVFRATDLTNGTELHILDPTNPGAGTTVVDIREFSSSMPADIVDVAGRAVFSADDGSGRQLFIVDPLNLAEEPIRIDINPNGDSSPEEIVNINGRAVFRASVGGEVELYVADPLRPEAGFLKLDINPTGSSSPMKITHVDGRVAFVATDQIGTGLFILSLDSTWNRTGSGAWDDGANWDGDIVPRSVENVVIMPPNGLTVEGPSEETFVSNLTLGTTNGTAILNVADGTIHAHNVTINSGGRLAGTGNVAVDVGRTTNFGTIDMAGGLQLSGGTLENGGLVLAGGGSTSATLENTATGEIRSNPSTFALFTGSGNTNLGEINLLGGSVEFTQDLHNERMGLDNGFISGRGTLFVRGGLTNDGNMGFSDGTTDIFGDVDNTATGLIVNSGTGVVTFFDDVINNGEIRTSAGSTSVFFGSASGGGSYTGTGTVHFEGDLSPGNSTAIVEIENAVVFRPNSSLTIELGGTERGTEYDSLAIDGEVKLDGVLNIELAQSGNEVFEPGAGDTFSILTATGGLLDSFDQLNVPSLSTDLQWQLEKDATAYVLDVVIAGDFNGDGVVSSADYTLWRDTLGQAGPALAADGNGDGTIGPADYDTWKAHFGWTLASVDAAAPMGVPEPCTLLLLLMAIFGRAAVSRPCKGWGWEYCVAGSRVIAKLE